jgi:hypothetical protein
MAGDWLAGLGMTGREPPWRGRKEKREAIFPENPAR